MNKRLLVIILLLLTIGLIGASVYIAYRLSNEDVPTDDASARAFQNCSANVRLLNCPSGPTSCTDRTDNPTSVFDSPNNCLWVENGTTIISGNHYGCPTNLSTGGGCQEERIAGIPPGGNSTSNVTLPDTGRVGTLYCFARTSAAYCAEQIDINVTGQSTRCQVSYVRSANCRTNPTPTGPVTTPSTFVTPTPTNPSVCPATTTVFVVDAVVRAANSSHVARLPVNQVQIAASIDGGVTFNNFPGQLVLSGSQSGTFGGNVTTTLSGPFNLQSNYTVRAIFNGQTCATSNLTFRDTNTTPTPTPTGSLTPTPTGSPTPTPTGSLTPTPTGSPTPTPTGSLTPTPTGSPTPTPTGSLTPTPTGSLTTTPSGFITSTPPGGTQTPTPTTPPNCGTPCNNGACDEGLVCNTQTNRCIIPDCYNNPNMCGENQCSLLPITSLEGDRVNKLAIGFMFMLFGITLYFLNVHIIIAERFTKFLIRNK